MIYHDIEFVKPTTVAEALEAYSHCEEEGRQPQYFAGGTELVTMARDGMIKAQAFIDLKQIPETKVIETGEGSLSVGRCVSLNQIAQSGHFPLLGDCCNAVADHTVRNSLTIGGNIAGRLPYREALLALLLADAQAVVASPGGEAAAGNPRLRTESFRTLFDKRLRLKKGEFLLEATVAEEECHAPYWRKRWERSSRVDYPVVTLACTATAGVLSYAAAGAFPYPVWGSIHFSKAGKAERTTTIADALDAHGATLRSDARGSAEYRGALLTEGLVEAAEELL